MLRFRTMCVEWPTNFGRPKNNYLQYILSIVDFQMMLVNGANRSSMPSNDERISFAKSSRAISYSNGGLNTENKSKRYTFADKNMIQWVYKRGVSTC